MSVLAIDTAGPAPSVAVLVNGRLFEEPLGGGRRASEELLPAVARALSASGVRLARCARIAVCAGPGSFTGVRVGLATAWGFGRALGVPVEAVSTLEAMAEAARPWGASRVAAFLDAGRGEIVGELFDLDAPRAVPIGAPALVTAPQADTLAQDAAIAALPGNLAGAGGRAPALSLAAGLAHAVERAPRPGASSFAAIYSRPSAAEEKHGAS